MSLQTAYGRGVVMLFWDLFLQWLGLTRAIDPALRLRF